MVRENTVLCLFLVNVLPLVWSKRDRSLKYVTALCSHYVALEPGGWGFRRIGRQMKHLTQINRAINTNVGPFVSKCLYYNYILLKRHLFDVVPEFSA